MRSDDDSALTDYYNYTIDDDKCSCYSSSYSHTDEPDSTH